MKYFVTLFLLIAATCSATAQTSGLFPLGTKAPNVHHTGDIWLYHPSHADEHFDYNLAVATSAPGAYLHWHLHPAGQQLIVTEGVGYYQERGGEVMVMRKGDVIKCAPGVEHWHGSTPDEGVTYLAISGNQKTRWLEEMTAADYAVAAASTKQGYVEQSLLQLSRDKWQWLADKDTNKLAELFHPQAKFVHMGGSWGTARELAIIRSGGIHYKQADIHKESVEVMGNTAVVLSNITLLAVVGDREVTNPFEVTEVYIKVDSIWRLGSMSFTSC